MAESRWVDVALLTFTKVHKVTREPLVRSLG